MRFSVALCGLVLSCLSRGVAGAENWPTWRGPAGTGVAGAGVFPTRWSRDEHVAWKQPIPGKGTSTPTVWGERVFVTGQEQGQNLAVCLDLSGRTLWRTTIGEHRSGKHRKASGSNPSSVVDGEYVFVYFKSGDLACLDFDGKILWQKNLQKMFGADTLWWDLGTSPVLTRELVVIACIQSGDSYVVAFQKGSGTLAWKRTRNLEAPLEAAQSYATPIVTTRGDREQLFILGADHVTAHNAVDGAEIWRVGGLNPKGEKYFRSISSPVLAGDLLLAPYARGTTMTAIRLGGQGDVTESHIAWTRHGIAADVPTPVFADGRAYVLKDRGAVACIETQTGKTLWSGEVEKSRQGFSSSPILAGRHLYITREDGKTFVLRQGDEFKLVASNTLGEPTFATPVFVNGQILIRTQEHLYCIATAQTR